MRKILNNRSDPEDNQDEGLVNLTPLIDVVFVVLICFILIAPMLEIDRISLANTSEFKEDKIPLTHAKIALTLREDNSIWLNKEKIPLSNLFQKLQSLKKCYPKDPLHLFPDRKASFGMYQEIKNIAEACGFEEMDIVLSPAEKKN